MKRLIRKAFGTTVYHGTSVEQLKLITESGMILPQESTGAGTINDDDSAFDGYTFFATSLKKAWDYANSAARGGSEANKPVILELDVPEDSLLPDDDDCPTCKTWQESASKIEQVKVLGQITDNYFTHVRFNGVQEEGVVNYANWEQGMTEYWEQNDLSNPDYELKDDWLIEDYEDNDEEEDNKIDWKIKFDEFKKDLANYGMTQTVGDGSGALFYQNAPIKTYLEICEDHEMTDFGIAVGSIEPDGNIYIGMDYYDSNSSATFDFNGNLLDLRSQDKFATLKNRDAAITNLQTVTEGINSFVLNGTSITLEEIITVMSGQEQPATASQSRLRKTSYN